MGPRGRWLWAALATALLAQPAARAQLVVPELSHTWTVDPGDARRGAIELRNVGPEPLVVEIRQSDYAFHADGRNLYPPPGSTPRSNADWIGLELSGGTLRLAPDSAVSVPYLLRVPEGHELAGTYWSLVHVDVVSAPPAEADPGEELAVRHVFGYGIQLVTHIGDTGRRELRMAGTTIEPTDDGLTFQVDLENPGERSLRPAVWLEVYEATGRLVDRFDAGRRRIHPGCSVRLRLALPALGPGTYPAVLMADNLDEHVWAAQVTIEVR